MKKADKAGGCYGEKMDMKMHAGVAIGTQKNVNFMSDSSMTAPKMNNDKAHDFRPGGTQSGVVTGKKSTQSGIGGY